MRAHLQWVLALTVCAVVPEAEGFVFNDGREAACLVQIDGADYAVPEEYVGNGRVGERHPELGGSAAVVRRGADGRPRIAFDTYLLASIAGKLPFARDFVFFHECAHIQRQTFDEIEANCHALTEVRRLGLIDGAGEVALGEFHVGLGRLPLKYGGSGASFWRQTLQCIDTPGALPPVETGPAFPGGMFETPFAP